MTAPEGLSPTPEQREVIASVGKGPAGAGLMIEAGAGCAKTSTLQMAAGHLRCPALALAFNKRIAQEARSALPSNFLVKTFNGLGHSAWARGTSGPIKLDERKLGKLCSEVAKAFRQEIDQDQWDGLCRLVEAAQAAGLVPREDPAGANSLVPDNKAGWQVVNEEAGLDRQDFDYLWELGQEVLRRDIALARKGLISFDDQIYCPTMLGGRFPRFPMAFVDEDQDLSPLQVRMLGACAAGRIVAVGDRHQAIYQWRGASGNASDLIQALRGEAAWEELPLLTSFRCPKAVVLRQQGHVPGFRAWETNPQGSIIDWKFFQPEWGPRGKDSWGWKDIAPLPGHKAILCRNNAPLLSLAFKLLRQGVGVQILGRDIGKGLAALARKIAPEDSTGRDQVRGLIQDWMIGELSKARANQESDAKQESIQDRGEALLAVLDSAGARSAGALRALLAQLFARTEGLVTLSSIHRAKGMEWGTVLHLDPWRIPSKQARQRFAEGDGVPLAQEANLRYVCETRTKHTLILANLEDFQ